MITWRDVPGWCEFDQLYRAQVEHAPDGAQFVEIGTFVGRSTCLMAQLIRDSGKDISFDAVDWGEGDQDVRTPLQLIREHGSNIHKELMSNLQACGVAEFVRFHASESVSVSHQFGAESVDFCFIDGAHDEEAVTADIAAWRPKMKPGGVMAGHDWGVPSVQRAVRKFCEPLVEDGCWIWVIREEATNASQQ